MACRKLMTPLSLLMQRLPKLMCNTPPIFQDVKLTPMDYAKARCLGPHCQCGCENGNAQRVRVQIHGSKNCKNKKKGKCGNPLCQRKLYVPHWAAKDIAETMEILPRHQPLPKKMPQPGSAASKPGAFRHHLQDFANVSCPAHPWSRHGCRCPCTWNSRCLLPSQFYVDFKKLHQGLATGFAYNRILKQEMQSILGPVGVNTGMNDLSVAMSQCWDWAKLAMAEPTQEQQDAFWFCFKQLAPFLRNCLWPDPSLYPMKRRHWDLAQEEVLRQYKLLCWRVRHVYAGHQSVPPEVLVFSRDWRKVLRVGIKPVRTWGILCQVFATAFYECSKTVNRILCHVACSKVVEYLGYAARPLGWTDFFVHEVSPEELRAETGLELAFFDLASIFAVCAFRRLKLIFHYLWEPCFGAMCQTLLKQRSLRPTPTRGSEGR